MEVLRIGEGKKLEVFEEIKSEIIFSSRKMMLLLVDLKPGQIVPEHRHPHELFTPPREAYLKKALL